MASRVYSYVLWQEEDASGGTYYSSEVPPGLIWVVRDISVYTTHGAWLPNTPPLFRTAELDAIGYVGSDPYDPSSPRNHWQGRQVLETGDQLTADVVGSNWYFRISGYELSLP